MKKAAVIMLMMIMASASMALMPSVASEYVLKIFGNANMDQTIDEADIDYLKEIISGSKTATELSDANQDGKIDENDVAKIESILSGERTNLTLIDQANRVVTVPRPAERIALTGMLNELKTLIQLGASDRIVSTSTVVRSIYDEPGRSKYFDPLHKAAPDLKDYPRIDYKDPNLEEILTLNPDIILTYVGYSDPDPMQEKTDIPTVCAGKSTGGDLSLDEHRILGWVVGKEKRVDELVMFLDKKQAELEAITSKIPENEKPKVYVAHLGPSREDILQVMIRYDSVDTAGGINVAKDCVGESAAVVSKEQIIAWNPDIILLGSSPGKEHRVSVEDVLSDPTLQTVNAIKNGRVYYTKGCMIGWDPATVATEAFYFAKLFHPERFKDLDVEKECNEILEKFYGVDSLYTEMSEKCELYDWK